MTNRGYTLAAAVVVALIFNGCGSGARNNDAGEMPDTSSGIEAPDPSIDRLQLNATHTVVDLDGLPGADGVQVALLLWRAPDPLAATLRRGTIEFLMYEGRIPPTKLGETVADRVWTYSANELSRFAGKTAFGNGYALSLNWGEQRPKEPIVTVSARLLRPGAPSLYAQPINLAVGAR